MIAVVGWLAASDIWHVNITGTVHEPINTALSADWMGDFWATVQVDVRRNSVVSKF